MSTKKEERDRGREKERERKGKGGGGGGKGIELEAYEQHLPQPKNVCYTIKLLLCVPRVNTLATMCLCGCVCCCVCWCVGVCELMHRLHYARTTISFIIKTA